MPFLPSIIKRIDEFYKIAERYSLVSLGASDAELMVQLSQASEQVLNPELRYNLTALAAMYQKALEINGGFNTLYKMIQSIVEDMDPDEEETEPVENLMNQIASSIRARAARPDSPGDLRELQMAATSARTEESPFMESEPEEDDEESAYEAMLGYGGADKAFEEEGGVAQFDPTGGVSPEAARSGTGRGYSVGQIRSFKDWAELYANEREKYERDLTGPDDLLSPAGRAARTDVRVQSNLRSLIDVLGKLSKLTYEALKLENKISLESEVEHPEEEAQLAKIRAELRTLERERRSLKKNLNKFYKTNELDLLKAKRNAPGTSPQEKRILDEKIKLQELRISGKYGYGKEAKERAKLITALTADPNLSEDMTKKMQESINGAAQFTDKMTRAQYDRIITEQRGKEQAREVTPTYEPGRGGARTPMHKLPKEQQIDLEKGGFTSLLHQVGQDIGSVTMAARQAIYRAESGGGGQRGAKAKENPEYKRIIDEISAAIRKKDRAALYDAQSRLAAAVSNDMHVAKSQLKGYADIIRLEPHFRKVLETLRDLTKNEKPSKKNPNPPPPKVDEATGHLIVDNFSEEDKAALSQVLNDMHRLRKLYTQYYVNIAEMGARRGDKPSSEWWAVKKQITPRFRQTIDNMGKIEVYLNLKLHVHRPEDKKRYPEKSMMMRQIWEELEKKDPKRFEALKRKLEEEKNKTLKTSEIIYRMILLKRAQETAPEQEVDQATADRLANEIFDKIYDQSYQKMLMELKA